MNPRKIRTAGNLELLGGDISLDFANTVSTRNPPRSHNYLSSYSELIKWGLHAKVINAKLAERLKKKATKNPDQAKKALLRAIQLREMIYRIFSSIAFGEEVMEEDFAQLNSAYKSVVSRQVITRRKKLYILYWETEEDSLDRIWWPIIISAVELLISPKRARIRRCARREACDWLFVDQSKNGSRRWCSMNLCGSRAKAHRYYHRMKGINPSAP